MKSRTAWAGLMPCLIGGAALAWLALRPCEPVAQASEPSPKAPMAQDVPAMPAAPMVINVGEFTVVGHVGRAPGKSPACTSESPAWHCDWMSHQSDSSEGQFIAVCDCSR